MALVGTMGIIEPHNVDARVNELVKDLWIVRGRSQSGDDLGFSLLPCFDAFHDQWGKWIPKKPLPFSNEAANNLRSGAHNPGALWLVPLKWQWLVKSCPR